LAPTGYPKTGFTKSEWPRVQLDPVNISGSFEVSNVPLLPPGKPEIDVVADYLHMLHQSMIQQMRKSTELTSEAFGKIVNTASHFHFFGAMPLRLQLGMLPFRLVSSVMTMGIGYA
jgi:hypothetical protein